MTGHIRGDARKRASDAHHVHPDAAVRDLIARERQVAAVEALREAAGATFWMAYPTSRDPRDWATWLRQRADRIAGES